MKTIEILETGDKFRVHDDVVKAIVAVAGEPLNDSAIRARQVVDAEANAQADAAESEEPKAKGKAKVK